MTVINKSNPKRKRPGCSTASSGPASPSGLRTPSERTRRSVVLRAHARWIQVYMPPRSRFGNKKARIAPSLRLKLSESESQALRARKGTSKVTATLPPLSASPAPRQPSEATGTCRWRNGVLRGLVRPAGRRRRSRRRPRLWRSSRPGGSCPRPQRLGNAPEVVRGRSARRRSSGAAGGGAALPGVAVPAGLGNGVILCRPTPMRGTL